MTSKKGNEDIRQAIKLLISAGKVIEPSILNILKQSNNPQQSVEAYLKEFPENGKLDTTDLELHILPNSRSNAIIHQSKPISKGSSRKQGDKSTIDERITKQIAKKYQPVEPVSKKSSHIIRTTLDELRGLNGYESQIDVVKNFEADRSFKGSIDDIIGYFQNRYDKLARIFRRRLDVSGLTPIKDVDKMDGELSVIGMVTEKRFPSNGGGQLQLEDPLSERMLKVIISKANPILVEESLQIMDDSVICVVGHMYKGSFFAKEILLPEVPIMKNRKFASVPVHVAFLSDIHVGSKNFLEKPMQKFVDFLNGRYGDKKLRALGQHTKYVMFSGDVVDGIGIYPNQINDLAVDSIQTQYDLFTNFIDAIPEDVQIVIIPGNHDMVRSAEPQPRIESKYVPQLEKFKNIHMLSNPSQIAIHKIEILLYHCTSIPDIINHIPGIQTNKPVEVMKQMLKARHLAPIWGSKTPIAAENEDYLVIDRVPQVFHGGHIHINGVGSYRGVQIVNSGTMQKQTSFQKSLNIIPTPGQISLLNLKSLKWSRLYLL